MDPITEMEALRCQVHEQLIDIFNIPVKERVGKLEYNCQNLPVPILQPSNSDTPNITDMPPRVLQLILKKFNFKQIADMRLVSKYFEANCAYLLNSEFYNLQVVIQQKVQDVKAVMPKRVSQRKTHPKAHECEILETLTLRISLLSMAFDKPIEKRQCCFFPGEILDEVHRILKYLTNPPYLRRAFEVTKELYEISNMAFEHLRKCIKPLQAPKASLSSPDEVYTSFMSSGSSSSLSKPHWYNSENKSTQEILLKQRKDRFEKVKKQIEETDKLAMKNRTDILKMKNSLQTATLQVADAVKDIQEFLKQKTDCQRGLHVFCDSALDDSAIESSPEVHTFCQNKANSTKNLSAAAKKNKRDPKVHINDNLTTEPPMKKKKK